MGIRLHVIQEYLSAQADLRAVLEFASAHDHGSIEAKDGLYESKIPLTRPKAGEQYAFSVDLDACTGCKACVVGCNKMNGLDPGESFRSVGLIHGGAEGNPIQKTVTTACHHCLDPACMNGCPVGAYEKDPLTGIVKHLDDQCIGCQYCTLTCPYEVPQYNSRLGIVRKCDMCSSRLDAGEAPACVQSCPNGAISIRLVETREVLLEAQADAFLPGAPSPGITAPTTTFRSQAALPKNALPANFFDVRPAAKHMPLVIMLVLTQLSVGAFAWDWLSSLSAEGHSESLARSLFALGFGLIALFASTFHLGRPLYAFRAVIGLGRSWMSREIVAFGVFVSAAQVHSIVSWCLADARGIDLVNSLGVGISRDDLAALHGMTLAGTAVIGGLAVFTSAMIYVSTNRKFWSPGWTFFRFYGSAALLGGLSYLVSYHVEHALGALDGTLIVPPKVVLLIGVASVIKLLGELSVLGHLKDKQQGDMKRSALLLSGPLRRALEARGLLLVLGGMLLPFVLYVLGPIPSGAGLFLASLALVFCVSGELLERMLFFQAVSAPRMPGGLGQ